MDIASPVSGAVSVVAAGISLIVDRCSSYKNYGGITGDTEGHFLQICELAELAAAVFAGIILNKFRGGI